MSKKNKVKEKWIAPYVTPGIAKHLQTHRQATHRMGCSCALFVFDETWRFQSQSTAFGLLRGYLAAAKLRIFPEWITIIPRKSHICSLKLSFFLFQKLKMNSVTHTGLTVAMGITIETMEVDVKMVIQLFGGQLTMLTVFNAPTMGKATFRHNRKSITFVEHSHGT